MLDPGEPHHENMYEYSDAELAARGIEELPRNLGEAVEAFAADPWIRATLGDGLTDEFIRYKSAQWQDYHNAISAWEVERYARFF
jgi:glutamine synthetase